ncbi:hypothetical protein CTAYLR_008688 [Chrysophaeum taylorii]|uniref:Ketoreductase domain-containing protein n=1 Tax=Chrysophaeum taylorii TaxID=2483200 RepID=A0AAD7UNM4_9STRA|nr:hypothetical protein CTAYLR_008688 [Chrysophaeum taylorii]
MKTILVTGATDGIGLETARALVAAGHHVLVHGRNPKKLRDVETELKVESFVCDLSRPRDVEAFADAVAAKHSLDVLINNAGVFQTSNARTPDGLDARFAVNALAPVILARRLPARRVVSLSSAAQAPVDLEALAGRKHLGAFDAYAQSKLALTMWNRFAAEKHPDTVFVAVNPGSMLGTKMVKEAYGVPGGDLRIGADILVRAALDDEFANASGQYYDNDARRFSKPHPHALDPRKVAALVQAMDAIISDATS